MLLELGRERKYTARENVEESRERDRTGPAIPEEPETFPARPWSIR
jgi:hypothetical protein